MAEGFDDILARVIHEIDPESQQSFMELIVRELVNVGIGKKGSARENVAAALGIIERVSGEGARKPDDFFNSLKKHIPVDNKFKMHEEEPE